MQLFTAFQGLLLSSLLMGFIACSPSIKSGYKIKEATLIEVIIDFEFAKAATFKYPEMDRDSISELYHEQIYQIYGINKYDFQHDIQRLEKDPVYYKVIIDKVHARMQELKQQNLPKTLDDYD